MNAPITTDELRVGLAAHLDSVPPPEGDLEAIRRRARARRTRRVAGPALLGAAAVAAGAVILAPPGPSAGPDDTSAGVVAAEGPLDLSHGLRAYASPSERLYLGGTSIPLTPDIGYLDTDAVATPYGLLYTDPQGQVQLIGESGTSEPLTGPSPTPSDWHPTIKADPVRGVAAWATIDGDDVTVTAYDLEKRSAIARTDVTCGIVHPDAGNASKDDCAAFVIDAVDSGAVFLRGPDGTKVWNYDTGEWFGFAGPKTRIADVRNKVVLFDGPAPTGLMNGWTFVPGKIDAQLTLDGKHVLYWSDALEPVQPGGDTLRLDLPVKATFFTIDTDGSVLAATVNDPVSVFDCDIPSGACEKIGEMSAPHGDPMFIGDDM